MGQQINPLQITLTPPTQDDLKTRLAKMPTKLRIEYEKMLNEDWEKMSDVSKIVFIKIAQGLTFPIMDTMKSLDTKDGKALKKAFNEINQKFPDAIYAEALGNIISPSNLLIGSAATKTTKAVASTKLIDKISKMIPYNAVSNFTRDTARYAFEGLLTGAMNETTKIDKWIDSWKQNGMDHWEAIKQRSSDVVKSAKQQMYLNSLVGNIIKIGSLPFKARAEKIGRVKDEYARELEFSGLRPPGEGQKAVTEFLNIPSKQAARYRKIYGEEIPDTFLEFSDEIAGGRSNITSEDVANQFDKGLGKNNIINKLFKIRSEIFKGMKSVTEKDIEDIFSEAYGVVAKEYKVSPERGKEAQEVLEKLKKEWFERIETQPFSDVGGGRVKKILPTPEELSLKLEALNDDLRAFDSGGKTARFGEEAIYDKIGNSLRKKLDELSGGKFAPIQKKIYASNLMNEQIQANREAVQKGTKYKTKIPYLNTVKQAVEDAAAVTGFSSREVGDMLGHTSITSNQLKNFRKELESIKKIEEGAKTGKKFLSEKITGVLEGAEQRIPLATGFYTRMDKMEPGQGVLAPTEESFSQDELQEQLMKDLSGQGSQPPGPAAQPSDVFSPDELKAQLQKDLATP